MVWLWADITTGHVAKTGNRPGSRGLAICSLPDFPAFAQAVRYGVPGTPSPPETMTGRVHTFGPRDGGAGRCVGRCDRRAQRSDLQTLRAIELRPSLKTRPSRRRKQLPGPCPDHSSKKTCTYFIGSPLRAPLHRVVDEGMSRKRPDAGPTRHAFSKMPSPRRISSRKLGSKAAAKRFLAMLSLAG